MYGSLAGLSLWPVFQAVHSGGNPLEIGGALATLAGNLFYRGNLRRAAEAYANFKSYSDNRRMAVR